MHLGEKGHSKRWMGKASGYAPDRLSTVDPDVFSEIGHADPQPRPRFERAQAFSEHEDRLRIGDVLDHMFGEDAVPMVVCAFSGLGDVEMPVEPKLTLT